MKNKGFLQLLFLAKILTIGVFFQGCSPALKVEKTPATEDLNFVPEPAKSSDSFVETIGIATHWGYRKTVYGKKWDELREKLGDLGVRYVRDSYDPRLEDIWRKFGVKTILITQPTKSWEQYNEIWLENRHLIAAIEGPNEVDIFWRKKKFSYKGECVPDGPRFFQNDLYQQVKGNPALKDIPVIGFSTGYKGATPSFAPLRSFDFLNAHIYPNGQIPYAKSRDFNDSLLLLGKGGTCPPVVVTESGYHTCLGNTKVIAGSKAGVTHRVQKKYIPRLLAEYFNSGAVWAVVYEFAAGRSKPEQVDPEAAFGLLMPDGKPKPAYFAVKDMISLLAESKWDPTAKKWIKPTSFKPQALAFALEGLQNLYTTLFSNAVTVLFSFCFGMKFRVSKLKEKRILLTTAFRSSWF